MSNSSDAIRRQLDQLNADLAKQTAVQQQYGQLGEVGVGQAYDELGNKLNTNLGEIRGTVDMGRANVNSAYDTAQSNIGTAEDTVKQLLGRDIAAGKFSSPLAEIQRLNAENSTAKANSLSSYEKLGLGNINAGQLAIGDAAREGTDRKTDLKSQIAAQIQTLQSDYMTNRSAMEVQLAQVLDEEQARADQMALEREKMAQDARENALNRAAAASARASGGGSGGGSSKGGDYGKGRSGLLKWAAANNIPKGDLDLILSGVGAGARAGDPATSYAYVKDKNAADTLVNKLFKKAPKGSAHDGNLLNEGLDVYFGNY